MPSTTHPRAPSLRSLVWAVAFSWLPLLAATASAAAEEDSAAEPVYMTGAEVRIDRPVDGDLIAAAGRIHVDQPIAGDAVLGAGSLDVQAPVGEDLRAAGAIVTLGNRVRGEVMIAAARIVIGRGAELHGHAWLGGSHITIGGLAFSGMKIYGRHVRIEGATYGPLEIVAETIEIGDSARIHGNLGYSSARAITISSKAQVTGTVTRTGGQAASRESEIGLLAAKPLRPFLLASLFAAGLLLYALSHNFVRRSVKVLTTAPAKSLGLGTALFFSVPPVVVLLLITIIGIPLGIFVAACHILGLLAGYLVTAFLLAEKSAQVFRRAPGARIWDLLFLAAALVLLALAGSVPYAGPLVLILAAAGGMGAMLLQAFARSGGGPQERSPSDAWPAA